MSIQTTTKELFKERMKVRKTEPVKASVLGMLIDSVQKSLFDQKKEETPADICNAAKKMHAEVQATILEYKKGNADTSELEEELKILEPYLPDVLSAEAMEEAVKKVLDAIPEGERVMKNIMPKLKDIEGIDMKSAKAIVDKLLK